MATFICDLPDPGTTMDAQVRLDLTVTQTDPNNGWTVVWFEYLYANDADGYPHVSNASHAHVTVDRASNYTGGTQVLDWAGSYNFPSGHGNGYVIGLGSGTFQVPITTDGTKTLYFSFDFDDAASIIGDGSSNQSWALPTIPRATVPTLSDTSKAIGQAITVNLPRASTSFTHDITYAFATLTGQTTGLAASTAVATSTTFTPPPALAAQMRGLAAQQLTFTVVTKNGATVIGSKTVAYTVTPANGTVYDAPSVNLTVVRALANGTQDDQGTAAKVTMTGAAVSINTGSEQNTLTYLLEVSADAGTTWKTLVTATLASHALTMPGTPTTYADADPGTAGTQAFVLTAGFQFRATITDALGLARQIVKSLTTANAYLDVYKPNRALAVGSLYDPTLGGQIQGGGRPIHLVVHEVTITTASLAAGAWDHAKTVTLAERAFVAYVRTSAPAYVRIYKDAAARSADSARAAGTTPNDTTGVCYECATATGALTQVETSPIPIFNNDGTMTYPIDVNRISGSTAAMTVTVGIYS